MALLFFGLYPDDGVILLHSERAKLHTILAFLSAIGLILLKLVDHSNQTSLRIYIL